MNNEQLIYHFYTCFKNKDIEGMQNCYADNAIFNDTVFRDLHAQQVRLMWAMLIGTAKDLYIEFSEVKTGKGTGSAQWVATYTFSATGRKVVNPIKASFQFENGKIVRHEDEFDFYQWAKQALGLSGLLLGWTPFLKSYMDTHRGTI